MNQAFSYASTIINLPGLWTCDNIYVQNTNSTIITIPWGKSTLCQDSNQNTVLYTHIPPTFISLNTSENYNIDNIISQTNVNNVEYITSDEEFTIVVEETSPEDTNTYTKKVLNPSIGQLFTGTALSVPSGINITQNVGNFILNSKIISTVTIMTDSYTLILEPYSIPITAPTYTAILGPSNSNAIPISNNYILFENADQFGDYTIYDLPPFENSGNVLAINGVPNASLTLYGTITYNNSIGLSIPGKKIYNVPVTNRANLYTFSDVTDIPSLPGYSFTVVKLPPIVFNPPQNISSVYINNTSTTSTADVSIPPSSYDPNTDNQYIMYINPQIPANGSIIPTPDIIPITFDTLYTFEQGTYAFAVPSSQFTLVINSSGTVLTPNPTAIINSTVNVNCLNSSGQVISIYKCTYYGPIQASILEDITSDFEIQNITYIINCDVTVSLSSESITNYSNEVTTSLITDNSTILSFDGSSVKITSTKQSFSIEFIQTIDSVISHVLYYYNSNTTSNSITNNIVLGGSVTLPSFYNFVPNGNNQNTFPSNVVSGNLTTYTFNSVGTFTFKYVKNTVTVNVTNQPSYINASISLGDTYTYTAPSGVLLDSTTTVSQIQPDNISQYIVLGTNNTYTFYNTPVGQSSYTFTNDLTLYINVKQVTIKITTIVGNVFNTKYELIPSNISSNTVSSNVVFVYNGTSVTALQSGIFVINDSYGYEYLITVITNIAKMGVGYLMRYSSTGTPGIPPTVGSLYNGNVQVGNVDQSYFVSLVNNCHNIVKNSTTGTVVNNYTIITLDKNNIPFPNILFIPNIPKNSSMYGNSYNINIDSNVYNIYMYPYSHSYSGTANFNFYSVKFLQNSSSINLYNSNVITSENTITNGVTTDNINMYGIVFQLYANTPTGLSDYNIAMVTTGYIQTFINIKFADNQQYSDINNNYTNINNLLQKLEQSQVTTPGSNTTNGNYITANIPDSLYNTLKIGIFSIENNFINSIIDNIQYNIISYTSSAGAGVLNLNGSLSFSDVTVYILCYTYESTYTENSYSVQYYNESNQQVYSITSNNNTFTITDNQTYYNGKGDKQVKITTYTLAYSLVPINLSSITIERTIAVNIQGPSPFPSDLKFTGGYLLSRTPFSVSNTNNFYTVSAYNSILNPNIGSLSSTSLVT